MTDTLWPWPTHPAAALFPLIDGDELQALADDIAARGLQEPIWLYHDPERGTVLLDGRNRYRACQRAGVPVRTRYYTGHNPIGHVVSYNLRHRHLTTGQRAALAYDLLPLLEEEGRRKKARAAAEMRADRPEPETSDLEDEADRPHPQDPQAGEDSPVARSPQARDLAAAAAGTSGRGVARFKRVAEQAPDLADQVRRDEVALDAAERELKRRLRRAEVEQREAELAAQAEAAAAAAEQVRQVDAFELIAGLDDGSVHLLATDPPYAVTANEWDTWPDEDAYWAFMAEWLAAARPKMADPFTAFIFCDADASPRLASTLVATGWPVLRQAIWHRPNLAKKRSGSLTFLSSYEPFWHCGTRGLNLPDEWGEERFDVQKVVVPQSTHRDDPSYHPTQKPLELMRRLVRVGSYRGELVVDPFCGSGTTALAAEVEGRRWVAGDYSERYVRIARGRIAEHRASAA